MTIQQYPIPAGGIPTGETADRPANPSIGDVFYNGTLGILEIYTSAGWVAASATPGAPTAGTATNVGSGRAYNNGRADVTFTPSVNGGNATSFTVTSSPGGYTGTGASSPISVTGLQSNTSYTFTVTGANSFGQSGASNATNSITATTVPQAPTIGTASVVGTAGNVELTFTAGATGGSAITNYKYSTDGTNYTAFSPAQTTSPLTITGLTLGVAVTLRIKAVNANGDSDASAASNSVTPLAAKATGGTITISGGYVYHKFTSTGTLTPSQQITNAQVLSVAGAGGTTTGTGGAGGALVTTGQTLANGTAYTATVGAGGAAGNNTGGPSSVGAGNGTNSNLTGGSLSLTAAVGGGGSGGGWTGSGNAANAQGGGSGGGGTRRYTTGGATSLDAGGAGTSGQGNNGGNGGLTGTSANLKFCDGGGGGAGGAGGAANATSASGAGGNGTSSFSAWGEATSSGVNVSGTYYFAAAAGGGAGESGAGANGTGWSNTANTGNSGIANGTKTGNSGIVIVRYQ